MNRLNLLLCTTLISTLLIGLRIEWVLWLFDIVLIAGVYHFLTRYYQMRETSATTVKLAHQTDTPRPRPAKHQKKKPEPRTTMQLYVGEKDGGTSKKQHYSPQPPPDADQGTPKKSGFFDRFKKKT